MTNHDSTIDRLNDKMENLFDSMIGRSNGMVKSASPNAAMSNDSYRQYRSSFLTLSDMQIPDDFREIFKWCRYFFKFDSLVGSAVRSLATFPITDYVVNDSKEAESDDNLKSDEVSESFKFYKNMLDELNLFKHVIEIGYDYNLYGNAILFAEPGTKMIRSRNPETGEIIEKKQVVWKSVRRLDPARVRIDRCPETQEKLFYYEVPADLKAIIKSKKPKEKYDKIPDIYKKAVEKNGIIRLNNKFVYHFSMPSESGDNGLWATPPILHAMKLILYTNVLRQAQEAVAYEHIVPRRIYYFNETAGMDPNMDFGQVADDFAFELKKQLNDPNYQVISPIPIQEIQHGGQGRNLLLVPEIEQLQNTILAALNVPREFIFGGVSYSGSTTSLRILENNFITYRMLLEEYINNFLIKRLAELRGEWEVPDDDDKLVTVTFADLKMQDDIQQKELMVRLNQSEKIPDEILYEKVFGLDATKVEEQLHNEQIRKLQHQYELQKLQFELSQKLQAETGGQVSLEGNGGGGAGDGQEEQLPTGQEDQEGQVEQPQESQGNSDDMNNVDALAIAEELTRMRDIEAESYINSLPPSNKVKVQTYYLQLKDREEMQTDMRPMPEKLPPRRDGA